MQAYLEMWRRTFDYAGRSGRGRFWSCAAVVIGIDLLASLTLERSGLSVFGRGPTALLAALQSVPMTALLVRRYRDAGVPVTMAVLAYLPHAWIAYVDATVPYPDNDDGPAMMLGGCVCAVCWGAMVVLASLRGRDRDAGSGPRAVGVPA